MKRIAVFLVLLVGFVGICSAQVSKKGDVILGAGWGYNAAKDDTSNRDDGLVASIEGFVTDKVSLRADYFRAEIKTEETKTVPALAWNAPVGTTVEMFVATSKSKGLSLCLSPHLGALSFPIGLLAVDVPDRNAPAWGGTAGASIDFWADKHLGLGFAGSYQYLQNTALRNDFWNMSGQIRLRF